MATAAVPSMRSTSPLACMAANMQGGGLAVGPSSVIVVNNCLVDIIDAATGVRLHELVTTHNLSGGAFGAGSFWIVDVDAAKLLRFDSG